MRNKCEDCVICGKNFEELGLRANCKRIYCRECAEKNKKEHFRIYCKDRKSIKIFKKYSQEKQLSIINKRSMELLYEKELSNL